MWKWIIGLLNKRTKTKPKEVIKSIVNQPKWIVEGMKIMGYSEVKNNYLLRTWLKSDGKGLGDPSKFPWCGDFVETALKLGVPNLTLTAALKANPYWARNWTKFGIEAAHMPYGAVVVLARGTGGHVAFAVGRSSDNRTVYLLGGNQSDSVSIVPINADRILAVRWPSEVPMNKDRLPVMTGGTVSVNEA